MKSIATIAMYCAGGATLFGGSFVVFSALSGVPLHDVALLRNLVPAQQAPSPTPTPAATHSTVEHDERSEPPAPAPMNAGIGVLGSFLIPSPYSAGELAELSTELRTTLAAAQRKDARNTERERELDEWERSIQTRLAELSTMRKELEKYELELSMRKLELERDENAKSARMKESFKEIARFFDEGDAAELVAKLTTFTPAEAAHILRALDEERASQLVNALPPEKYQEYVKAYRESKEE